MDTLGKQKESPGDASPRMTRADPANSQDYETNRLAGRWTGLRARLMLFVTAVLLGPLGMIGYDTYNHYRLSKDQALRTAVGLATSMAGRDFGIGVPIQQLLLTLSRNDDIVGHDAERCSRTVKTLLVGEPRYAMIGAVRPDGTVSCQSAEIPPQGVNVADREWFQEAVAKRNFSKGQYINDRVTGIHSLAFAYPAVEEGEIKAVLFAGLNLVWVSHAIQKVAELEYIATYLLDRSGLVLARSHDWGDAIGRRMEDPRLLEALDRGRADPFVAKDPMGIERIYILRPLESIGAGNFYFAAGIDSAKLAAAAYRQLPDQLASLAVIAFLAYLVAWWGSALAITEPISRLLTTVERFRKGDSSAREGPVYARNEIGFLGRALDALADTIGHHKTEMETAAVKLRSVIDNIAEGIVTADERGTILTFNPAAERITGYTAKEMIGRDVALLATEPHRSRHSEYIAAYLATGKGRAIGETIRYRCLEAQRKDGTIVPIELGLAESWVEGSRVFIGVLHDISARVKAEASEKRRARDMEALFQTSPAAIIALDREAKVMWWNPAAERIFGYSAAEVLGRLTPVIPESELASFWSYFERIIRGELVHNVRGARQTKSGRKIEIEFSGAPLTNTNGDVIGGVYVISDITEHVQLQQQFLQAQKMESIGQLTGGIAHDFNNLLGVLIGNLDLARERLATNPEALDLVDAALDAGLRGAELNKRLLAFARQQALNPEVVDVNATLAGVVGLLARSLGEQIKIHLERTANVWLVRVDPSQMETVIVNLAVNARDAMPKGGMVTFETQNVTLDADYAFSHKEVVPGDYVMLAVSDTGIGMTPEVLSRVFDPFFTTKPVGKGTGLGLSMVYGFIKQSGGHVNIYSEPGKGTIVRLYLPRAASGETRREAPAAGESSERADNELLLVVEDNPDMRRVAVRQLKELGYRVAEAENADRARTLLDEGLKPDLMFVDIVMPGFMDGVEFAEEVAGRLPEVRILLTSGFTERATIEARRREDRLLPFALLGKPYRKDQLARAIRAAMENGKKEK